MGRIEEEAGKKKLTPDELELRGLTLRAIGWLFLIFNGIVCLFLFVGIRTGSLLWFYWTVIEGAVGIGLIAAGMRRQEIATSALAHMAEDHLHAEEVEHPKAA